MKLESSKLDRALPTSELRAFPPSLNMKIEFFGTRRLGNLFCAQGDVGRILRLLFFLLRNKAHVPLLSESNINFPNGSGFHIRKEQFHFWSEWTGPDNKAEGGNF